jgi:hypothetical protein
MSYLEDLKKHYKEVRKRMELHAIPEPRPVMFLPPRMLKQEAGTLKPGLVSEKDEKEIICKALRITSIDDLNHHSQAYRMADELLNSPRLPPLPGLVISETGKIRWMRILHHVAKQHGLEPSDILSESRKRHIINARFEVFYRLRIDLAMSYTKIAILFGKDHSTIVHGVGKVRKKLLDEKRRRADDGNSLTVIHSDRGETPPSDDLSAA